MSSLLIGQSASQDICPLVPRTTPGLGPSFEGGSIVQVLWKRQTREPGELESSGSSRSPLTARGLQVTGCKIKVPKMQTFSKREILQAFRVAASSTSTGPRPKMSRRSSLF